MSIRLSLFTYLIWGACCQAGAVGEVNLLSNHYPTVTCMVEDKFNNNELFICAQYSVKKMNVEQLSFTDVAGVNNIQGYAEGVGDQARFTDVEHILQINSTTVITTDYGNHCLRQVTGTSTSTYAGNCTNAGVTDGSLRVAKFYGPIGFVQVGTVVFLTEWQNRRIRLIDLVAETISTFVRITNPTALVYIDCFQPCDFLYFTMLHGVASVKRTNKDAKLVAGSLSESPAHYGRLNETTMSVPEDILVHNERFILVADRNNNRVLLLDLQLQMSQVIASVLKPWSLHLQGDMLLIGTQTSGIYTANISEYLNIYNISSTIPTTKSTTTTATTVRTTTRRPTTRTLTTGHPTTKLPTTKSSMSTSQTHVPVTLPHDPNNLKDPGITSNQSDPEGVRGGLETNVLIAIIVSCVAIVFIIAIAVTICVVKFRKSPRPTTNQMDQVYNPSYHHGKHTTDLPPVPGSHYSYRDSQNGAYEEINIYDSVDPSKISSTEQPPAYEEPYIN